MNPFPNQTSARLPESTSQPPTSSDLQTATSPSSHQLRSSDSAAAKTITRMPSQPSYQHPAFKHFTTKPENESLTDAELLQGAKDWLARMSSARDKTFDTPILRNCRAVSASMTPVPSVTFELEILEVMGNGIGNFHGGAITTTFDNLTSCPLFLTSKPGMFQLAGVSRNLNVSFLRPAPIGSTVLIECSVLNMGRRLALVKGEMRRKDDGVLVATCMHDKANTDPGSGGKL